MMQIKKIEEFERNSYKQKSGTPTNHAELIRTINLLIDMVNYHQKVIEELQSKKNN